MQNFGLNKNILILTIVLFALIAALGVFFAKWQEPHPGPSSAVKGNTIAINKNIADLNNLDADLVLYAQDDIISQELDATLSEVGEINEATTGLTNDEENLSSLDSDLGVLSGDEAVNKEIDQSLQEVSL